MASDRLPICPIHKKPMQPRKPGSPEQAWCGTWYECPAVVCSAVLVPSAALTAQIEKAEVPAHA